MTARLVRRGAAVTMLVVSAVVSPVGDANADPIDDQRRQVSEITDQLAELEERADVLAEDHVVALDEQRRVDAAVVEAQARVDAKTVEVAAMRNQLAEVAVRAYIGAGGGGLSPLLTNTSNVTEVLERQVLSKVALSSGDATVDEFDEAIDDLNDDQAALEAAQREAVDRAAAVAAARQANEDSKARYQQARQDAEAQLGDLIREEEERRARESYERAQRAAEQAAAEQAAAAQAARARAQATPPPPPNPAAGPTSAPAAPVNRSVADPLPASAPPAPPAPAASPEPVRDEPDPSPPPPAASSRVDVAINAARTQLGVPWVFAMAQPGVGFDCSGLTKWAWGQAGVSLPHQSRAQAGMLPEVATSQAQPGDLLFYYSPISHVGIYLGGGQLIHSPNSGTTVKIANVNWNNVTRVGRPG